MKKLLFLFLLFAINSCEIYYDGETRLIIDTVVKDFEDNTPLKNIPFKVIVTNGHDTETISTGFSDNEGRIISAFPAPKSDTDYIRLEILPDEIYEKQEFVRILKSDFTNFKLTPSSNGLTKKDRITNLFLEIIQTSTQINISELSVNAIRPELIIDYNPENNSQYPNLYYYPIPIMKNQTISISYKLTDYSVNPPSVEVISVPIVVENQNINYQLIY